MIILETTPLIISIIIGLMFSVVPFVQHVGALFSTLIHEVGHACISIFTNIRMGGIHLHWNASGETYTYSPASIIGWFLSLIGLLLGYFAPLFASAGCVVLIITGNVGLARYIIGIIGLFSLIFSRSFVAFIISGITALFGAYLLNPGYQPDNTFLTYFLISLSIILGIQGLKSYVSIGHQVFTDGESGDFDFLEEHTDIPPSYWYVFSILLYGVSIWFFLYSFL